MAQLNGAARLFVALWPDAAVRDALQAEQARWRWPQGAAPTPPDKLHLTLHFIGEASEERAQAIAAGLSTRRAPPLRLVFDRRETWDNGCAVLRPREVPEGLQVLHDAVGRLLHRLGVALEARAWHPHVTLARKARGAVPPVDGVPLAWTAHAAVLVRSHAGRYAVLPGGGAQ